MKFLTEFVKTLEYFGIQEGQRLGCIDLGQTSTRLHFGNRKEIGETFRVFCIQIVHDAIHIVLFFFYERIELLYFILKNLVLLIKLFEQFLVW